MLLDSMAIRSIMDPKGRLVTKIFLLAREYGKTLLHQRISKRVFWTVRRVLCDWESMTVTKVLTLTFWSIFMVWWLRFQGIIKPKLNSSRDHLAYF